MRLKRLCVFPFPFLSNVFSSFPMYQMDFPDGSVGKESSCSVKSVLDPWVGKIPWRRAWQPTPVSLPGEPPWTEQLSIGATVHWITESDTTEHSIAHMYQIQLWGQTNRRNLLKDFSWPNKIRAGIWLCNVLHGRM